MMTKTDDGSVLTRTFDARHEWSLPAAATSAAAARMAVGSIMPAWVIPGDAVLVTSELVTDAVRDGDGWIRLRVERDRDRMRIEVLSARRPGRAVTEPSRDRSMPACDGFAIIEQIASDWGRHDDDDVTTVWAELLDGAPTP